MRRLCVFCGSSPGADPAYAEAARGLGGLLAKRGIALVYGGGNVGLMGVLADSVLSAGGTAIGVIPQALEAREVAHRGLSELHVVGSMHERKALMAELADGFIMLPGGIGTLEEFFEVWTWAGLGLHRMPCGLLNVRGFYTPLVAFLDQLVAQRFLQPAHRAMVVVEEYAEPLLARFAAYAPPLVDKWLDRESA